MGMVLVWVPGVRDVTVVVMVQVPLAGKLAPVSERKLLPAAALTTPLGQVVLAFGVWAILICVGKLSTRVAPARVWALLLPTVRVRVEVPLAAIVLLVKTFEIVGW